MELTYANTNNNQIYLSSTPSSLRLYEVKGLDGLSNTIHSFNSFGQDGITINNSILNERPISILGKIITRNKDEMEYNKKLLLKTFHPKLRGTLEHKGFYIDCIVDTAPVFSYVSYNILDFVIELIAPYPYLRKEQKRTEIAKWKSYFHFPVTFVENGDIIGYREQSLIANVYNEGEVESPILVEFTARGDVVKPKILNVKTNEFILIKKSLVAGERILVNTEFNKKRVTRIFNKEESNAFHFIDLNSTFFHLDVGDNLIKYDAESGLDNLEVNIYHTPLYLGV